MGCWQSEFVWRRPVAVGRVSCSGDGQWAVGMVSLPGGEQWAVG